jgi:excisionase family DNA binding protein
MHVAEVLEMPFMATVPKREKSKLVKLWDHFNELKAITAEKGMLIPQHYAAQVLGISRQRVHVLVNDGRIEAVEVGGCRYVTEESVVAYAHSERKAGRPVEVPTVGTLARFSVEEGRRAASKIS